MPKSTNLSLYNHSFYSAIAQSVAAAPGETLSLECDDERAAARLRLDFYGWRRALAAQIARSADGPERDDVAERDISILRNAQRITVQIRAHCAHFTVPAEIASDHPAFDQVRAFALKHRDGLTSDDRALILGELD